MKNHPSSSFESITNDTTLSPLGWNHMPAFGSGYREFAAGSLPLPLASSSSTEKASQTLPLSSFWSTVAHAAPRQAAALC